ncbi:MAG: phenylalanine--tRNA ligase subunit alpha [Candidatus Omnitrophica bacterium]|nr:phenylalanine--tRNA ligase subunit alpha [Candidatus Omnitrophota bacterium]
MLKELKKIQKEALAGLNKAGVLAEIEKIRVGYLGRKGRLTEILKSLRKLPSEQRAQVGKLANDIKNKLMAEIEDRLKKIESRPRGERVDITLPGIVAAHGNKHPVTRIIDEICDIFVSLGLNVVEGPEAERERYNFEALNIPLDHPSRDAFDTFYIKDDLLLRSHTSPVQIRVMEKEEPPVAVIVPGKVYRPDAVDATHSFMFHQVEGLVIDKNITFSDLKGTLSFFANRMFGDSVKVRFRPHFFPFTEPSADLDISCIICGGKGCRVCSRTGWLEVMGAGMVDPEVFKAVGYNYEKYSGFAFGMGVERIAMLKYGVNDIRLFFENDLRFLRQWR